MHGWCNQGSGSVKNIDELAGVANLPMAMLCVVKSKLYTVGLRLVDKYWWLLRLGIWSVLSLLCVDMNLLSFQMWITILSSVLKFVGGHWTPTEAWCKLNRRNEKWKFVFYKCCNHKLKQHFEIWNSRNNLWELPNVVIIVRIAAVVCCTKKQSAHGWPLSYW